MKCVQYGLKSLCQGIFINALISFASIFSNSKVLARIRFVEMPEVRTEVPDSSMPEELGGDKRKCSRSMG